ncbi:hypothetical protein ROL72_28570, partial [Klebsiella pneumoniae]
EMLGGDNLNLWFRLSSKEDWFSGIELVLMRDGGAEIVFKLSLLNDGKDYRDWKVSFIRRNV